MLKRVQVLACALLFSAVLCCSDDGLRDSDEMGEEQTIESIEQDVERALEDDKSDSPDRPVILGDITPNMPAMGQFRPERRYVGWTFRGEQNPTIQVSTTASSARPRSGMVLLLLWRPNCNSAWRTLARGGSALDQRLPTDGDYLIVVGPRNARSVGSVQALLSLAAELLATIGPSSCVPGPFSRPAVPQPLPPSPTERVGAINGAFEVTDRGTATYRIPLELPPGRAGIEPRLALAYESGGGSGILGTGFRLEGLSAISRCSKDPARDGKRQGIRLTAQDALCLDGQRLVQVASSGPGDHRAEYRTERESFMRVRAYGDSLAGPTYFRAWAKDGRILEFGLAPDGSGQDTRVRGRRIAGSADNYTLAWLLRRIDDRSGNFLTVGYEAETGSSGETVEQRPSAIVYTGWTDAGPGGRQVLAPTRRVEFSYEEGREDAREGYQLGARMARTRLLRRVDVHGPAPTVSGNPDPTTLGLVRRYELEYEADPASKASRLRSLSDCGATGNEQSLVCKPSTKFGWHNSTTGLGPSTKISVRGAAAPSLVYGLYGEGVLAHSIDMDGDGRSDVLYKDAYSTWRVLRSLGDGSFEAPLDTGFQRAQPIDWNGDGRTDLLVTSNSQAWSVALSQGTDFSPAQPIGWACSDNGRDCTGPLFVQDFDGDGRTDLLACDRERSGQWRSFHAPADGQWSAFDTQVQVQGGDGARCEDQMVLPIDLDGDGAIEVLAAGPGGTFGTTDIERAELEDNHYAADTGQLFASSSKILDVNGDGLSDIVRIRAEASTSTGLYFGGPSALLVLISRGDGTFERREAAMSVPPHALADSVTFDHNGDGRVDLLVPESRGRVTGTDRGTGASHRGGLYLSNGEGFAEASAPSVSLPLSNHGLVLDLDADGLPDLAHLEPNSPDNASWHIQLHAGRGQPPNLLAEIRDGLTSDQPSTYPATVAISYLPLGDSAVHHAQAPGTCQYPVRCPQAGGWLVSKVKTDNAGATSTGRSEQQYTYHRARYDVRGRGFLGFAERHLLDTHFRSIRTYFQGNEGTATDSFRREGDYRIAGMIKSERTEIGLPSGRAHISSLTNTPALALFGATYLPLISTREWTDAEETTTYQSMTTSTSLDQSGFGCVKTRQTGFPDGFSETVEVTEFQNDAAAWLLCLPRSQQHTGRAPGPPLESKTRKVDFTYHPGTALVHTATREPSGSASAYRRATVTRDRYGNVTQLDLSARQADCTPRGANDCLATRTSVTGFDDHGMFPLWTTNPLGHRLDFRHHPASGALLVREDENGLSTRWGLDGFARSTRQLDPDNTETTTTLRSIQDPARPGYEIEVAEPGGDHSITRYDALSRVIRDSRAILGGRAFVETHYTARGWVDRVSRPTLEGSTAQLFTRYAYDGLGRVVSVTAPDGTAATMLYSGSSVETTDPDGSVTKTVKSPRREVVEVTAGLGSPRAARTKYYYGPFGALRRIESFKERGEIVATTIENDAYGRRALLDDPNVGETHASWTGFDELRSETAPGGSTTYERDALGRVTKRTDGDGETTWVWDASNAGVGRISETTSPLHRRGGAVHRQVFRYDGQARLSEVATTVGGSGGGTFVVKIGYDAFGRPDTTTYPGSTPVDVFAIRQKYDEHGQPNEVRRWNLDSRGGGQEGQLYWRASQRIESDFEVLDEEFGSGLHTVRNRRRASGRLESIWTGRPEVQGSAIQDLSYDYHPGGSVHHRRDGRRGRTETFLYDELGRLTTTTNEQPGMTTQSESVEYDLIGNIRSKSGVGAYQYMAPRPGGGTRAHAVSGAGSTQYGYDRDGNLNRRQSLGTNFDQRIDYTAFGKPYRLGAAGGTPEQWVEYTADGERVTRYDERSRTVYVADLYERTTLAAGLNPRPGETAETHRYFVRAGGRTVAVVLRSPDPGVTLGLAPPPSESTYYVHDDHLGSITTISRSSGGVLEDRSFDAFGKSREPSPIFRSSVLTRGFTGHEEDPFGLINMKGRMYDPKLGRFLSPDPFAQTFSPQGLNRYSYVLNNPLRYTDPTGYDCDEGGSSCNSGDWIDWSFPWGPSGAGGTNEPTGPVGPGLEYDWPGSSAPRPSPDAVGGARGAPGGGAGGWTGWAPHLPDGAHLVWDGAGSYYINQWGQISLVDPEAFILGQVRGQQQSLQTPLVTPMDVIGGARLAGMLAERLAARFIFQKFVANASQGAAHIGTGAGRKAIFNPTGGKTNCVNGVCSFLQSVRDRTLNLSRAMEGVSWNGGRISQALSQISNKTGARFGRPQVGALETARSQQFFVVFRGTSLQTSDHVAIGIVKNGRARIYDPQSHQLFDNPADFGPFTAHPLIFE